jgi:hypothetical protein
VRVAIAEDLFLLRDAARQARRENPGLPVLVLSQYVEQLYARELLASGIGYLLS